MGNPTGFLHIARQKAPVRAVAERVADWREVELTLPAPQVEQQAARCMDCGIPFCHQGCPLGNLVPDWNDRVYRDRWFDAFTRLRATNNFPDLTGRLCPAPCEGSCVLGIGAEPVAIKSIERAIADHAFEAGWFAAAPPPARTGRHVAVIGSGPGGLAAADQLNAAGHLVTVFERADRIGGLLRYGIPEFKLEKSVLDRRLRVMADEGVRFRPACNVGVDISVEELRRDFDAIVLACGVPVARNLDIPGRELSGIHFAMDYLTQQNRRCAGDAVAADEVIDAAGKHVVIIGGGDTGADCLGTATRQGAASIRQLELMPRPPDAREADNPWPQWPRIFRMSSAHEEGGERLFAVSTQQFIGDERGHVRALQGVSVVPAREGQRVAMVPVPGSTFEIPADLVFLAMGFTGAEPSPLLRELGVALGPRGTVARDHRWMTSAEGVFVTGDMQRGQSLIVWAIADGRQAAAAVDAYLSESASVLR